MFKRFISALCLLLGILGTVICLVGILVTWTAHARATQATKRVFAAADEALIGLEDRVAKAEQRVEALKLTTADIKNGVGTWAKAEAGELISKRLALAEKAELLLEKIDRAEHWLEVTESSAKLLEQTLHAGESLGIGLDTSSIANLLKKIEEIQGQLRQGLEVAQNISEEISGTGDAGILSSERAEQLVKLAARVVATVSSIDERIQNAEKKLEEIRQQSTKVEQKVTHWITLVAVGLASIGVWMGLGQVALSYLSLSGLRGQRGQKD